MKFHQALFTASLFVGLTAGLGCSETSPTGGQSTGGTATEDGKTITSVEITPSMDVMRKGGSQQFRAVAHLADGTTKDITSSKDIEWKSSDTTVATVSKGGMVSAVKAGAVDITVEYKGEKSNARFVIMP
jgi:uncharacterized protein YjdB